jgi:hypothetical protein
VREPLLHAFPFPSTGKGDTAPAFSGLRVDLQFMWEVGLSPSPVQFSSHCHFHKLSCSWLLGGAAALASPMFVYSSRGKWVFPSLLSSFPPSATLTSFPATGCWACLAPATARGSLACRLVYLQSQEGFPSPNLWRLVCPTLFPACLICSYCLLLSFSFFPRVEVSLSRGLCCYGPGLSVGVPWFCEAHLVCVFPSRLGAGDWQPGGPTCFSV